MMRVFYSEIMDLYIWKVILPFFFVPLLPLERNERESQIVKKSVPQISILKNGGMVEWMVLHSLRNGERERKEMMMMEAVFCMITYNKHLREGDQWPFTSSVTDIRNNLRLSSSPSLQTT